MIKAKSGTKVVSAGLAIAVACGVSAPVLADSVAVIVKAGSFSLSKDRQTIVGENVEFDDSSSGVFGIEGEWRQTNGLALGIEYLQYENDFGALSVVGTGTMDTSVLLFNVKKYFQPTATVNPYIGAGFGAVSVDFSGDIIAGSAGGFALQAIGGVEFRFDKVGLYTELKALHAEAEDDAGEKAKAGGSGVFAGVSISF